AHLGGGRAGPAAWLGPNAPLWRINEGEEALPGFYQTRRGMTLTYPMLNRARRILFVVTGAEKVGMLARFRHGDDSIPAGRIQQEHALVIADRAAFVESA